MGEDASTDIKKTATFLLIGDVHYGYDDDNPKIIEEFIMTLPRNIDVLLLAGDLISHEQTQLKPFLHLIRLAFPSIPIYAVRGNHDYWSFNSVHRIYFEIITKQNNLFKDYDIHLLESNPAVYKGIGIFGYTGWYGCNSVPTNDYNFIQRTINGVFFHDFLFDKSLKEINEIIAELPKFKKSVILTHFEPNDHRLGAPAEWVDWFKENAQEQLFLCCGHSHQSRIEMDKFSLINSGGDYNRPAYYQFEVEL